jgi:hypothetical protein
MRGEFLNESLFFGLDHDRSAIEHWVADFNAYRPHFALLSNPADVWRDPGRSDEILTIVDVDDALAVPARTMPLRFRADGLERPEWTIALQVTASAKFDRTSGTVEAAPIEVRNYAHSIGALITIARAPGDFW